MLLRTRTFPVFCLLALVAAVSSTPASAQAAKAVEGSDYRQLETPQPTQSPGKIEVLEFFSYGCPHCNDFYPLVRTWLATQPKDVAFRREAVGFGRPQWVNLARAYYALQATGDLAKLDGALFHALHEEGLPLYDEQTLSDWVGKHGGNADKFTAAYTSFGVNNQTVQADTMAQTDMLEGIPTLVVNGHYVILGENYAQMLANADKVIVMLRAQAKSAAASKK
jgi:thiol:disulfide interchange protein DsbA